MEIRNRLFPYPVLCGDTDDYQSGEFTVSAEIASQDNGSITLKFNIVLINDGLRNLISRGDAEYIIHIECSGTSFRTALHTYSNEETYRISSSKISGEVALLGMIISKKDIKHYKNSGLNEDYEGVNINIPQNSIMAYHNMPKLNVIKNYEELSSEDSMFSVVRELGIDKNEEKPIHFQLDPDRIKIYVSDEVYKIYVQYQNSIQMRPMILSILVMPALVNMIEELRFDSESYESCTWYMKFCRFYEQQGKDFIEDVINGEKSIMETVQEMLQLPVSKTFINMQEILGD